MLERVCSHRDFVVWISALRSSRAAFPSSRRQLRQDRLGDELCVSADADRHRLRQTDAVRIDVDLDDLGVLGPIVQAISRKRRERIESRAKRQHDVGLCDELHGGLRPVVAKRADGKPVIAGKAVIVLIVVAHRRIELLGERTHSGIALPSTTPAPDRMAGNLADESSFAASATALAPPAGSSNSTIAGKLMSMT
jgi:hypothetical protein